MGKLRLTEVNLHKMTSLLVHPRAPDSDTGSLTPELTQHPLPDTTCNCRIFAPEKVWRSSR